MTPFAELLSASFQRRRGRNPRYSLRAFARHLGLSHGALSQILSGQRPASPAVIQQLTAPLELDAEMVSELIANERDRKLATSISSSRFRPDARRLATISGLSLDEVCVSLQRMLSSGRLRMTTTHDWTLEQRP